MLRSHAPNPKKLWDHCLELEAFVRLCTTVPETVMKGQPADISNICEYEWYQWVMYLEPDVQFPVTNGNLDVILDLPPTLIV